ncbi:peptidoglycan editing factor PgeF [Alteromonas halophila]|uniref:Purine nucleoside phosphorylase n=1 Tax=Alteromonas halophila TaxID=516698 RepID=A0A918JNC5_9ALTE|nr:peptidoglycan editing factor PgeF [Alteromonas halophila]GGW85655.1 laccase domain protein [Alteromonas halophila]
MNGLSLIYPVWEAPPDILAYTTTRAGGISEGTYASLNVGEHVGDEPGRVKHNRSLLPGAQGITWLQQVHSNDVVTLPATLHKADAAISRTPGLSCAVMTADCVPVLLCNQTGTEVAAIHAGWRGLADGVIGNTVRAMTSPAAQLFAWIGPAICGDCYEVDQQLAAQFDSVPGAVKRRNDNKALLDLPLIAEYQLLASSIRSVVQSKACTYTDSTRFFSHRRASHAGNINTGRQVSVIGIRKSGNND